MAETEKKTEERPPIVAILGHIDHGKSTLLDYIRKSNVVEKEAGGITQHVNAYEIHHTTKENKEMRITFIDTPGHAAFTQSRQRGANIADVAVIIISAEEGVKEQTLESLKMAKNAKVPYMIAINKIDRPNANIDKVKNQLVEHGYYVEGYGGDIPYTPISCKTGEGIEDLLDVIVLLAELEELKGTKDTGGEGFVLESHIDSKTGVTAVLIIKNGTVSQGDYLVHNNIVSKIKRLEYFDGSQIKEATFSQPVQVYGLSEIALAGEPFTTFKNKKNAEKFAEESAQKQTKEKQQEELEEDDTRALFPLVIKADVIGTLEALKQEIEKLSTDRVRIKILDGGIGDVSEKDIKRAEGAKNPIVIGFHVKTDKAAKDLADNSGIPIITFDIVYKVTEFLEEEIKHRTPKIKTEELVGRAKVIRLFSETKKAQVVGAKVLEGEIKDGATLKIVRNENEIGEGKITEMQRDRVKVKSVTEGEQFGATVTRKTSISLGDELRAVIIVEK